MGSKFLRPYKFKQSAFCEAVSRGRLHSQWPCLLRPEWNLSRARQNTRTDVRLCDTCTGGVSAVCTIRGICWNVAAGTWRFPRAQSALSQPTSSSLSLHPYLPSHVFSSGSPTKTLRASLFSPSHMWQELHIMDLFSIQFSSALLTNLLASSCTRWRKKCWLNLLSYGCLLLQNSLLGCVYSDPIVFFHFSKSTIEAISRNDVEYHLCFPLDIWPQFNFQFGK